ncbi:PH domain-containing protein [Gloeocapsa sp. BRSZ]
MNEVFKAPWAISLIAITVVVSTILVGIILIGLLTGPRSDIAWIVAMVIIPLAILLISVFFSIRGYAIADNTLYIQRLGWNTKVDLKNLITADVNPQAMRNSIRKWGNGGLFSFSGKYYNRKLGNYEAYATDLTKAVILKFRDRTIVVTPEHPERFANQVLATMDKG